ncbi:hypothetical protein D3C79_737610 [compost metagenome]
MRVSEQDGRAGFIQHRRHGLGDDLDVEGAGIGSHLAEVLVQCVLALGKLHPVEVAGPNAEPELIEPELLIGGGGQGRGDHAASRLAPAGLIHQVGGKAPPQEEGLEPFASIRGRPPAAGGLAGAVQHHYGVGVWMHRDLIKHGGVIAVIALPRRVERCLGIKLTRGRGDSTPRGEAALGLDDQGIG